MKIWHIYTIDYNSGVRKNEICRWISSARNNNAEWGNLTQKANKRQILHVFSENHLNLAIMWLLMTLDGWITQRSSEKLLLAVYSTQRPIIGQCKEWETLENSVWNEIFLKIRSFPSTLRDLCGRRGEMIVKAKDGKCIEENRHHRADTHINSQRLKICRKPSEVEDRQNSSTKKGNWTQNPTLI